MNMPSAVDAYHGLSTVATLPEDGDIGIMPMPGSFNDTAIPACLVSAGLRLTASGYGSESETESSLSVPPCDDFLEYNRSWQKRQDDMWARLDVDFILAGREDDIAACGVEYDTANDDADVDGGGHGASNGDDHAAADSSVSKHHADTDDDNDDNPDIDNDDIDESHGGDLTLASPNSLASYPQPGIDFASGAGYPVYPPPLYGPPPGYAHPMAIPGYPYYPGTGQGYAPPAHYPPSGMYANAQLPSGQHYLHPAFPHPHHQPSSNQPNSVAPISPNRKPKAKRQHSANADGNRPHHYPVSDDSQTSNGKVKAVPIIDSGPVHKQDAIATTFRSIAASPASGARAPSMPSSTAAVEAVQSVPLPMPINSANSVDSSNSGSSGTGMQFYTLQDGHFYNTGGFNPPTYPDKTGNTILACRHHWPAKGHKLCRGSDAVTFKCRLCLGLPLDNGIQSWNGRCLSWRLEAPDPLPETDCCPMIRSVRRSRLIYNLFPDGEIPANFVESWRRWVANHQPEPPSPHRSSIDNGEGSSRAPARTRRASTEEISDMDDFDDVLANGSEQSHIDPLYRSRSNSKGKRCILGIFLTGIIPADFLVVWKEWCKSKSAACATTSSQPALASDNSTHSEYPSLSRPSKTPDNDEGSSTQRPHVVEESSDYERAVSWEATDNEQ
ncbi:MAG: hypothetical protein J3R72DRAFT_521162 [Linnemannia gamsii]|nr:MAG: hypothetical protein J3R72DRAFT_521162 [Linnemannia gamsii]